MRFLLTMCYCFLATGALGGKKISVLFIGNSYTYYNNMPQIVADLASGSGDTVLWAMEAPGGYYLWDHTVSASSGSKILSASWDYVVLQEQSQAPALPDFQIETTFKSAHVLDSLVHVSSPCGATMFYMTWGRKNGDTTLCQVYNLNNSWPYPCTYEGMDSVIRQRYTALADTNHATVSPAGAVWHYIRHAFPSISLYEPDESHPSPAGSYAVACAFYTALFRKDPTLLNYNFSLPVTQAVSIRAAVKAVVFDSLSYWHLGQYRNEASFAYSAAGPAVSFQNKSVNGTSFHWSFGDGGASTAANPAHTYPGAGTYTARLISKTATCADTAFENITVYATGNAGARDDSFPAVFPNPCNGSFTLQLPGRDALVTITALSGATVYRQTCKGDTRISLHEPAGVYAIHITEPSSVWTVRLIIR